MSWYEALKIVHILSATLLFGTGLGTAYYFWSACLTRNPVIIAAVGQRVILADWIFTGGSGIVQPVTGILLARELGIALDESWLVAALGLYALAFACWAPVVWLQIAVARLAREAAAAGTSLGPEFARLVGLWFALGWPAFLALIATFALMVVKPALW